MIIWFIISFVAFILLTGYLVANYYAMQIINHAMSHKNKMMRKRFIKDELEFLRNKNAYLNHLIAEIIEYKFNKYKNTNV